MTTVIHPTASIAPDAELADGVEVGAYAVIGAGVVIGANTVVGPHAVVQGPTRIGADNRIFQFASVGSAPQDKKYAGEPTRLEIGDRNLIRECVTLNRGTVQDLGVTAIGDDNLFMAYSHVAHDCRIGDGVLFVNGATLGGHIEVGDYATVGAFSGVHQFCRVGPHAFIGGYSVITRDAMPFCTTVGNRAHCFGVNKIGLIRRGFAKDLIEALDQAVRRIFSPQLRREQALAEVESRWGQVPEVRQMVEFVRNSPRGVIPIRLGDSPEA